MFRLPWRTTCSTPQHLHLGRSVRNFIVPSRQKNIVNVYETTPRLIPKGSSPVLEVQKQLFDKYDPDGSRRNLVSRTNHDSIRPGDLIRVTRKDSTTFIGMLLGVQRHALATNILLRTKVGGVGVEHRFNIFSPNVAKIEQLRRPAKRWPKSKLYFIKTNPKIDVGDVDSQIRKEVHKLKMQNQAY